MWRKLFGKRKEDIKGTGALGTADFYKDMRAGAQTAAGDGAIPSLKNRVDAACDIMLQNTPLSPDTKNEVKKAVFNKLNANTETPEANATADEKAAYYTYKALMAEDKAFFSENSKRTIGAVLGLMTGVSVVGISGSMASGEALEALIYLLDGSADKFAAELAAGNPVIIGVMVGIALGITGIIAGAVTAVEVVEKGSGRRDAAKNLEDMVRKEYNDLMPSEKDLLLL